MNIRKKSFIISRGPKAHTALSHDPRAKESGIKGELVLLRVILFVTEGVIQPELNRNATIVLIFPPSSRTWLKDSRY